MVFPTCVGVFPLPGPRPDDDWGLPHVRGGVSHQPKSARVHP